MKRREDGRGLQLRRTALRSSSCGTLNSSGQCIHGRNQSVNDAHDFIGWESHRRDDVTLDVLATTAIDGETVLHIKVTIQVTSTRLAP